MRKNCLQHLSILMLLISMLAYLGQDSFAGEDRFRVEGKVGPGHGKKVILISGDEEYRSEEVFPQLAKMLAHHYGFDCVVLFAINPDEQIIDPNVINNIPGMQELDDADLMVIFTRWRDLPAEQMEPVDRFLKQGKPVVGIRTATHAFHIRTSEDWKYYGDRFQNTDSPWDGGFGRLVLGEHWVAHHGHHKHQSTRGLIVPEQKNHPIVRGLADGDIWGPSDVYQVRLPLPGDSQPLVLGQVINREGDYQPDDLFYGMRPTDSDVAEKSSHPKAKWNPNDPMMPIAWTKSYQIPDGTSGRAFMSTIGASTDFLNEGVRRLIVNGIFWAAGMESEIPATGSNVDFVGDFEATQFQFLKEGHWSQRRMTVKEISD